MDKYLLLFGFQLTQTLVLGAANPALWEALSAGRWQPGLDGWDLEALGALVQTLLSGTWVGRVAEFGSLLGNLASGVGALPLALLAAQWVAVVGLLVLERRVLARRLSRLEARVATPLAIAILTAPRAPSGETG